ncbi:hypothetical protein [Rhizobium croatiense]|uniref:hypothetical protein n=1 Tax=Rhizobium croatiense TaxID=2867516 RepID=UPI0023EC2AE1|nr:hypothetical protein [Rhizobium croatiense]WET73635.1 hypothetical protein PYR68_19750 [Rhizobium croatiense]
MSNSISSWTAESHISCLAALASAASSQLGCTDCLHKSNLSPPSKQDKEPFSQSIGELRMLVKGKWTEDWQPEDRSGRP